MPYIEHQRRLELDEWDEPRTPGELNYQITLKVQSYLGPTPNYARFNDAIGALEGAKLELYRRMVAPYEDQKIRENGDVYPVKGNEL